MLNPPFAKRLLRAANSPHQSDSEDDTQESDEIQFTKADIPMRIVDAVLSNFTTEGTSSKNDTQDRAQDISHPLDELDE